MIFSSSICRSASTRRLSNTIIETTKVLDYTNTQKTNRLVSTYVKIESAAGQETHFEEA